MAKLTGTLRGAGLVLALVAGMVGPASAEIDQSENVKLITSFAYEGVEESDPFFTSGTDIDFSGKYVYAMQQGSVGGGVHVIKDGKKPRKVAFIACPGGQNDVAVVKPGLIALGYHSSTCAAAPGGGIRLIDVRNPKRPQFLGAVALPGGTHTLTVYPGEDIIYASPGGLPTNGGGERGVQQIVDVSDPLKPEVVGQFFVNAGGCHDLSFLITDDSKLAFCPAGHAETQIWDVSDPIAPTTIGRIINPFIQFHHSAVATHDGQYLVVGDETMAADCLGGPLGDVFIYDISNPATPLLQGYYGIDRGRQPVSSNELDRGDWCTAHNYNFVPGTYKMVTAWYSSGFNVIDWTNPASPQEIAYYMGTGEDRTNYWSAYFYAGRVWANDRQRGVLDVFEVEGLADKDGPGAD
ncbi:MAG TPA: hypothetical protein VHJ82_10035 [Actinomycetota bacterium]|nr:hypothetical protein [Actinomycetota bacterium]